jgi:hypothetical protein
VPAELGLRDDITGVTAKVTELLATPPTVTTTGPVVAEGGTVAVMLPVLQLAIVVAGAALKVTVLVPCGLPKFCPVIVIEVPTAPEL